MNGNLIWGSFCTHMQKDTKAVGHGNYAGQTNFQSDRPWKIIPEGKGVSTNTRWLCEVMTSVFETERAKWRSSTVSSELGICQRESGGRLSGADCFFMR